MTMISEGEVQYETDTAVKKLIEQVIRKHGNTVVRIGRWALVIDQVFVSTKTPKPKPPPKNKRLPPPREGSAASAAGGDDNDKGVDAEPEQQAESCRKPPHLIVLKWIKPPPAVQAHLQGAKLGKGQAQFLEVRTDLWVLMSESDREAALMTKLLEREVVDNEDGTYKIRKADLPIQTHPAVELAYPRWWEHMDPESAEGAT